MALRPNPRPAPPRQLPVVDRSRRPTSAPKISVVVPALNEARNLPDVFARLPDGLHEVILVDGASVDGTADVARELRPDIRVIAQTRCGKGNALACGFRAVTGDIVIMLDADGSADPAEIPRFVEVLLTGADFAKGSRFMSGGGSSDITSIRRLGNLALNGLVNSMYRTRYTDLCYGYNAFWADCLPVINLIADSPDGHPAEVRLWGDGFEIETLITIRVSVAGLGVTEVPSFEAPRIFGESNLSARVDGVRVLRTILVERRYAAAGRSRRRLTVVDGGAGAGEPVVIDLDGRSRGRNRANSDDMVTGDISSTA